MGNRLSNVIFEKKELNLCSICFVSYSGFGNNAEPVNRGRCCDTCNGRFVIPARINLMNSEDQKNK